MMNLSHKLYRRDLMRICSFLPNATEIVYALGLQEQLYGVTFECDYPPEARTKPIVVRSIFGAVQQQRVYVVDANAYTSRSGPRLVCGLERFA
jgi:iron complex transport system substrate-binding protein